MSVSQANWWQKKKKMIVCNTTLYETKIRETNNKIKAIALKSKRKLHFA